MKFGSDRASKPFSGRPLTWKKNQTVQAQGKKIPWWDLKRAARQNHFRGEKELKGTEADRAATPPGTANCRRGQREFPSSRATTVVPSGSAVNSPGTEHNREMVSLTAWERRCRQTRKALFLGEGEKSTGASGRVENAGTVRLLLALHSRSPSAPLLPDRYLESKYVSATQMQWNAIKNLSFSDNYKSNLRRRPSKLTSILLYLRVPL